MALSEQTIKQSIQNEINVKIQDYEEQIKKKEQDIEVYSAYLSKAQDAIDNLVTKIGILKDISKNLNNTEEGL